jgi:hypothetical protein
MTDGPASIDEIWAFSCFFLTVESVETLNHSGKIHPRHSRSQKYAGEKTLESSSESGKQPNGAEHLGGAFPVFTPYAPPAALLGTRDRNFTPYRKTSTSVDTRLGE